MRGIRSLANGLLISLLIAATVFGALVLSVRGQPTSISELPIPTVTLQTNFASPTPTRSVTQVAAASVTATSSATPAPTPTICPIPAGWQRYSVGPFDTLNSIAQRFNLTPDQLVQANCLDRPSVTMGQTLYVPGFEPTPTRMPCFPPFNWVPYIVRPGDTLSMIASRYGISLYALVRANCLSTTYIYYGQILYVPPIYPRVTFVPTPFVPTLTPIPTIISPTPTIPPSDTPTAIPTTPVITDTPGPTDTPGTTSTPAPTDTPLPTEPPLPTGTLVPTEPPPTTPPPLPTVPSPTTPPPPPPTEPLPTPPPPPTEPPPTVIATP